MVLDGQLKGGAGVVNPVRGSDGDIEFVVVGPVHHVFEDAAGGRLAGKLISVRIVVHPKAVAVDQECLLDQFSGVVVPEFDEGSHGQFVP